MRRGVLGERLPFLVGAFLGFQELEAEADGHAEDEGEHGEMPAVRHARFADDPREHAGDTCGQDAFHAFIPPVVDEKRVEKFTLYYTISI